MVSHPAYETVRPVSPVASVILEDNPGPWTLEGTNSWILGLPGGRRHVVVDPGFAVEAHLTRLAEVSGVELILLTHGHPDHAEGASRLAELTGAPIRSADPAYCLSGPPLADNETLVAAGVEIYVLSSPGHSDDSVRPLAARCA